MLVIDFCLEEKVSARHEFVLDLLESFSDKPKSFDETSSSSFSLEESLLRTAYELARQPNHSKDPTPADMALLEILRNGDLFENDGRNKESSPGTVSYNGQASPTPLALPSTSRYIPPAPSSTNHYIPPASPGTSRYISPTLPSTSRACVRIIKMEQKLVKLRNKRGTLKGVITRVQSFVRDTISLAAASIDMLEARRDRLAAAYKEYEEYPPIRKKYRDYHFGCHGQKGGRGS
ncbi:hypothetical protein K1T71_005963 [Dendrolimus kikuchii]|uniref:Uncharacterized protein n=1 Tax=Dendrolimus kikuchii TaxID=765133 RepID=A0ACC1D2N1_9NEOP|nr:hypothetical protein K1T71_005963 [Dendrolimus kikuchii]